MRLKMYNKFHFEWKILFSVIPKYFQILFFFSLSATEIVSIPEVSDSISDDEVG